jgi:MobA/MobL family protein
MNSSSLMRAPASASGAAKRQQVDLLRDFVKRTFVSQGMVADFALHVDNPENRHAHVVLTMREMTSEGLGPQAQGMEFG